MSLDPFRDDITSQDGEDGIVRELLSRLGVDRGWCVEFGAWDGKHLSNTWDLWHNRGWAAVLIEGDSERAFVLARAVDPCRQDVHVIHRYVGLSGADGLDALLSTTPIPHDFEVLSVDIDGDDHHVWASLEQYRPRIVLIEYNPTFLATVEFVQEPGGRVGASIRSLQGLGARLGYVLVALTRSNGIFLRDEDARALQLPALELEEAFDASIVPRVYSDYDGHHVVLQPGPWGYRGTARSVPMSPRWVLQEVGWQVQAAVRGWKDRLRR